MRSRAKAIASVAALVLAACGGSDGVDPAAPTCTSFAFSNWAPGVCPPSGVQDRSVTSSSPVGCTGGSPVLTQSCTPAAVTCTSFTYSAWSPAVCPAEGVQSRTATSALPSGCTGGVPVLSQSCTPAPTTGTIIFSNATTWVLSELYVVPSGSASWGAPVNGALIASGGQVTISDVAPGVYSSRAIASDGVSPYFAYGLNFTVTAGSTFYLTADAPDFTGSLKVVNGSAVYNLVDVRIVPSSSSSWGANLLSGPLAYGGFFLYYDMIPGPYAVGCMHSSGVTSTGGPYAVTSMSTYVVTCN